jgi:serine/threonine protein phosphatase PrpC
VVNVSSTSPRTTRSAGATRLGPKHAVNEDAWCVASDIARGRGEIFAVADGVSTVAEGSWASRLTCERLEQFFAADGRLELGDLVQLVSEIDWELRGKGMGKAACTLSALWLVNGRAHVLSVGDSAVFRMREGAVERLTAANPRGRQLDSFMGMGPALGERLKPITAELQDGDGFLLVTDGVCSVVHPEELGEWWKVTGGDPDECANWLVREVERRRGDDDATVVAVRLA